MFIDCLTNFSQLHSTYPVEVAWIIGYSLSFDDIRVYLLKQPSWPLLFAVHK